MRDWQKWLIVIPVSVVLGYVLSRLHVPAAWILGAILASAAVALTTGRELSMNKNFFSAARGIIGVIAALPLVGVPFGEVLSFVIPGLVVAVVTIGLAFGGGVLLSRHGVTRQTGTLSLMAGGASIMPTIAQDIGADARYVALVQYLRLLAVSLTLPLISSQLAAPSSTPIASTEPTWWMWLLIPALVAAGQTLGALIHIPNARVFGPLLLTAIIGSLIDVPLATPQPLAIIAFLAIGWLCGGTLSVPALKLFTRLLPITLAFIVGLMAACAAMGWVISQWVGISYFEGYLATSPGAIETALALSAEGGAGPAVVSIQLIRLICILATASWLSRQ